MSIWVVDLRTAEQGSVAVRLTLYGGEELLAGVDSVDEETDTVMLYMLGTMAGGISRRRIGLNDIQSLELTADEYPRP